ncbi:MAG: hypothetical protein Q9190_004763 [Brigantiaea leucoxantha]
MSDPDFDFYYWLRRSAVPETPPPVASSEDETVTAPSDENGGHPTSPGGLDEPTQRESGREELFQQEVSDSSSSTIIGDNEDHAKSQQHQSVPPPQSVEESGLHSPVISRHKRYRDIQPNPNLSQFKDQSGKEFYHASISSKGRLPKEPRKRRRLDQPGDNYRESWDMDQSHKKIVKLWHGLEISFPVTVTEYTPHQEITDLFWKNPNGWQLLPHTAYGIQDADEIDPSALDSYTLAQTPHVLDQIADKKSPFSEPLSTNQVWLHTMRTAYKHLEDHPDIEGTEMLRTALLLWTYTFLQYHGLWQFTPDDNYGKLGMSQIVQHTKNNDTMKPFEGSVPLPRLLSQQIHTCIEGRMVVLEELLVKELNEAYRLTSRSQSKYDWKILYLTTWILLSILEEIVWDAGRWKKLSEFFDWPLEQSPDDNIEKAIHSARTVVAHNYGAVKNMPIKDLYNKDFGNGNDERQQILQSDDSSGTNSNNLRSLFKEVSTFAETRGDVLEDRKAATFEADDIRSLELKFTAMMISSK